MRCAYLFRLTVFFLISCFSPTLALAAEQFVSVHGDLAETLSAFRGARAQALTSRARSFQRSGILRLFMTTEDGKRIQLSLTDRLGRYWPAYFVSDLGITADTTDVMLLRGTASDDSGEVPLAGAIYEQNGVPTLFLDFLSADGTVSQHVTIPLSDLMSSAPVLDVTPLSSLEHAACGTEAEHAAHGVQLSQSPGTAAAGTARAGTASVRALEVATEADFEYFTAYGTQSNARIAAVINAADTIYQRDLSVDLQIASQHVVTTSSQPYSSTNSGTLLEQFRNYTNTNGQLGAADAFHLFTGKDIDGSVIGIAYVGVICASTAFSYGVTQDFGNSTYLVFAHEVGHNLDADHDSSGTPNVMAPSVSSSNTSFSAFSQGQIANHIANFGSCLSTVSDPDDDDDEPPPDPLAPSVSLTVNFDPSTNLFVALTIGSNAVASDCQTYLMVSADPSMAGSQTIPWGRKGARMTVGGAKNKKRIPGLNTPLFVQGVYSCPSLGVAVVSDVQSILPSNATSAKQLTSISKWVKATLKAAKKEANKKRNNT